MSSRCCCLSFFLGVNEWWFTLAIDSWRLQLKQIPYRYANQANGLFRLGLVKENKSWGLCEVIAGN